MVGKHTGITGVASRVIKQTNILISQGHSSFPNTLPVCFTSSSHGGAVHPNTLSLGRASHRAMLAWQKLESDD